MTPDPHLLAVARGDTPADLVLTNARIVNVFSREIHEGSIAIAGGRFASVGRHVAAHETIDVEGRVVCPGFIDAHMHVESTMLMPAHFVRVAAPHGTTGVVFDPHEIANVLGIDGIRFLMDDADGQPMNIMFGASSCVPASPLETAGASVGVEDISALLDDDRVYALAEMMNFPGVVHAVPDVLAKVEAGLRHGIVDGHCPGLTGSGLQAYVAAGISSDHECTTAAEAREKMQLGMRIYLREGSAARNLEALLPAVTASNAHRFCFCTDDRHPADLIEDGHIDHVVRRAIDLGLDPHIAIAMATINPAEHYRRPDLGAIAPGRSADLLVLDDLHQVAIHQVYHRGRMVARDGVFVGEAPDASGVPQRFRETVRLSDSVSVADLAAEASGDSVTVRVIGMDPHQLLTESRTATLRVEDGRIVPDVQRDILKLAVVERHHATGNVGVGFISGFQLSSGAIASTVGHDSHNITVVGTNDDDMMVVVHALVAAGGGQSVAREGKVLATLPLPIAGLISDESPDIVVSQQRELLEAAASLGCPHHDPFMPLSFMSLTVIPHLKLSDRGLVDVDAFDFVSVITDPSS